MISDSNQAQAFNRDEAIKINNIVNKDYPDYRHISVFGSSSPGYALAFGIYLGAGEWQFQL